MRRNHASVLLTLLMLAGFSLLTAVAASSASANSTLGAFEIDGNLLDDSVGGDPIDWSTPPPNLTNFTDLPPKPDDDIFVGGSKELQQSGWDCGTGSAPGKDDIVSGQLAFRDVGLDQYAYVNFFRDAVNGDAHIDYEFNQSTLPASAACPMLPKRTAGDVLIAFDTENGGATIIVRAFTWSGSKFNEITLGVNADGAVNIPPSLTIPGHANGDFGEAAINLSKTIGKIECGEFSGAYMKTRAATAINAALKDFTDPQPISPGVCPPSSAVSKAVRNATTNPAGMYSGAVDAKAGDAIDYQVTYANSGAGAASNVVVTDTIAAGQTYVADSCLPKPCSLTGNVLTWNLGSVAAGTTRLLTFQVSLTGPFGPGTTTTINNTAVVTTTEEGTRPAAPPTTVTVRTPNSSLDKSVRNFTTNSTGAFTDTISGAKPGQTIEYQLVYSNGGPGTATNVVVTDTVAAKSTYVAGSCTLTAGPTPPCTVSGSTITWNLGTVAAGASRTMTFKVTLTGPFTTATTAVENTAVLDSNEEPPESSDTTTVNVATDPSSSLDKSVRNFTTNSTGAFTDTISGAKPGQTIEYQLVYSNGGPGTATNVVVTDTVAAKSTYVAGSCTLTAGPTPPCTVSGSTITWNLGTVAGGVSRTMTFKVTLTGPFTTATTAVENTGVLDSNEEPPENSDTTTVNVATDPSSSLDKSVRNFTTNPTGSFTNTLNGAKPGETIQYQIVYTNAGPGTATNVVVTDTVAAKSTYVADSCTLSAGPTPPCTVSGSTITWNLGTVAGGVSRTMTFKVTLTGPFTTATTPVENVAVVDTGEEPPKDSDKTTVTVVTDPVSSMDKSVRNFTTNPTGSFTNTVDAKPGQTIEYQIVYMNAGPGTATNVVVTDVVAAKSTYVAGSCTLTAGPTPPCTFSGSTITWNLGTVTGGTSRTMTFKVTLTGPFTTATTPVENVAVVDTAEEPPKDSDTTIVNVKAPPNLTIAKAPNKTSVAAGDLVTYTLTYGNTGVGPATGVTITDDIPAGTTFESCSDSCTVANGTATWTIGTVSPAGGGSVTLTVRVSATNTSCQICNVAKVLSPDQSTVTSAPACVNASPASDPSTAKANGEAVGLKAHVPLLGIPLVNVDISRAASSRTGLGQSADDEEFLNLDIVGVVGLASVAKASVLRSTSSSQVTAAAGARQTSTSTVLGLDVLSGVVTADLVRSVASTTASGTASSQSAAGSTVTNLRVLGSSIANATPGLIVPLDNTSLNRSLYGRGSYVAVNDQQGSTSGPASGQLSGGTYKADLTVTMVRVHITGGTIGGLLTLGGAPVDITVARSTAHSEHKQTPLCDTSAPTQAVSGHAFIASAQANPLLGTSTVGYVEIPASGGAANKSVTAALLPADGSIVTTNSAAADTTGTNGPTSSTASSYAQTAGACVLKLAVTTGCLISATLIRSQANSSATSSARSSNATGTQFVDLVVAGVAITGTPEPNRTITLPAGLGFVVLNEQVPDGSETGHTGLTVRGLRVVVTVPFAPLLPGAEVIVAEAHSDATFR